MQPAYWKRVRVVMIALALVFLINEIIGGLVDGRF